MDDLEGRSVTEILLGYVLNVLDVHTYTLKDHGKTVVFTGRLREDSGSAYERLQTSLRPFGYHALLRRDRGQDIVVTTPAPELETASHPWLNILLLMITTVTTLMAGSYMEGRLPWASLEALLAGAPFALAILTILGAHELGHYFVARYHGMQVTLPYFIPFFPFFPLGIGTMGAVIRMKSPITGRKALFDVGLAGPIAGLIITIPVLVIGLLQSELVTVDSRSHPFPTLLLGESLAYKAISRLVLGPLPETMDVALSPIAFAGWFGLFVTALNLLPAGQLDGGHIAYAVWGRAHRLLAQTTFLGLIAMGIGPFFLNLLPGVGPVPGWSGWLIWALLLSVFGLRHPPVLDDVTPLTGPRRIIGVLAIVLLLLLITPVPFSFQ
jgi:membrane-associated protease RseP (regulator of RpoE activity)